MFSCPFTGAVHGRGGDGAFKSRSNSEASQQTHFDCDFEPASADEVLILPDSIRLSKIRRAQAPIWCSDR